ncbi:UDP-glucose 4-epimerase GalE [Candidatus Saccharibacteria bacterium]|nr:UDP-glucose 4-epimerase GalE [Candidatus Saccharibacteria bacterium]
MKLLLTGGTGYIGSHTAIELINQGYEVEIVDNLYNSKKEVLDSIKKITGKKPKFYQVDLLDYDKLDEIFKNTKYDGVIHFAGLKAVAESVEKPLRYYENNLGTTINLLKAMEKYGVNKIIFSSSATVYGDQDGVKLTEDNQTGFGITNPYGQTKYMIEQILKDASVANPNLEVAILRYFNPVGAHHSGLIGEDPNDIPNNLMPIIMKVATGEIKKLQIFGDDYNTQDGTGMRDFIHVVDLAKGHVATLSKIKPGVSVYNLGTGKATSVMEMVKAFEKAAGRELPYEIAGRRPGDLAKIYADPTKAEKELGWHAELTIEDAMKDTINYLNHLQK